MSWFMMALIGPFLWAVVNHVDKYLLTNHFQGSGVGVLMLFSTLTAGLVLPVLYSLDRAVLDVPPFHIGLLLLVGVMSGIAIWLYLAALDIEEASVVVPIFQTIPIFGLLFAYVLLGEVLTRVEITGCLMIMVGAVLISLDTAPGHHLRIKRRVLWLMLGSSALFGLFETLFKLAAVDYSLWACVFWEHVGLFLLGMLLLSVTRYRRSLADVLRRHRANILSINIGSEFLTIGGNVATSYALLLAPVALVLVVTSIQPLLVFLIGTVLSVLMPRLASERITAPYLAQKLVSITVICLGAVMINL